MRNRAIGNWSVTRVLVIFALGLVFVAAPGAALAATTERISIASDGTEGNDHSSYRGSAISADGRFVAFDSEAGNLVQGDTNESRDVFVHDRQTGQTERVSVASDGTQGNDRSDLPSISSDGRFVAFRSAASNLVAGDTNGARDVFVLDRQTGTTERVSVASDGIQGNSNSGYYGLSMSADGRFVAFYSDATNLVDGDTNGQEDVFVHDRETGQTTRLSVASDGTQGDESPGYYGFPSISSDGRFVAFHSDASNLVEGDTNATADMFVHDRQTGQTTRVSVASDGTQGNNDSYDLSISADGRFVAFESSADNLVEGDTNSERDIFVHDRETGQTTRVSVASDGTQANNASDSYYGVPSISGDGRFVAFGSFASNLVADDTNGHHDVFVHDRGVTLTVTTSGSGTGAVELSPPGGIYDEGTTVTVTAFASARSFFDHWEGDLTGSANPAAMLMDGHKNVVAHFIYPQLTVLSAPIVDVVITGTRAGTTPYTADCDLHEVVALTAPESVSVGGKTYYFELWFVDNVAVAPSDERPLNEVEVTMDDRRTLLAQYGWRLPGDYNDDCTVDILDLLYVRNRLQTTCSESPP